MFDFFFFICFCKWIWLICGVLIWGFLCYGFLSVSWCLWACVCTPSSGARRSESHGRFACYGVRTWGSRYRCGVPTHHWGYLHGKLKGRGGGEGKILGRLLENQGSGGQACEEGGVRETLSAWGRHWPQMLHRACSLQRRPQIILPHKSVATGPGRVDGGVEKMAKFHLLLIYTSRFLAPLNRTTVNINTRSNFGCCLSIFFFLWWDTAIFWLSLRKMKKIFISIFTAETQFIPEKKRTNTNEHDGHSQKTSFQDTHLRGGGGGCCCSLRERWVALR